LALSFVLAELRVGSVGGLVVVNKYGLDREYAIELTPSIVLLVADLVASPLEATPPGASTLLGNI